MLLMIFISDHTLQNVGTMLTLDPFHSTTLTRLTYTKGLTVWGVFSTLAVSGMASTSAGAENYE